MIKRYIFSVFIICYCFSLQAQENVPAWEKYIVKEINGRTGLAADQFYLIFTKQDASRYSLKLLGVEIIRKLDENYFIVSFTKEAIKNLRIGKLENIWEVNNLWKFTGEQKTFVGNKSYKLNVFTLKEESFIEKYSIQYPIQRLSDKTFNIICKGDELHKLLNDPYVIYIEHAATDPKVETAVLDYNFTVNGINRLIQKYPNLLGQGMTVSIKENQYNFQDIDLKKYHIDSGLGNDEMSPHATEMAILIKGAGNTAIRARGIAPKASVTSSDFNNMFPDPIVIFNEFNISLQNHSYGVPINNEYTLEARAYDEQVYNNPEIVHVFSSGNSGSAESSSGKYANIQGYANLTGGFKMAKNIITVGALDSLLTPQLLVSRGPAYDGRVKPELVAYSQTGSSASAALVSGTILLLQQSYKETHDELPSMALIKAALLNSAHDAGPKGIDFITGYGNMNAYETQKTIEEGRYFSGTVSHEESNQHLIEIPDSVHKLKITITWIDPAAQPGASQALVNDIDLKVSQDGITYHPSILNHFPHADSLSKPETKGKDHINNTEQITIDNPSPGSYVIDVNGYDVSEGSQEYYIAYMLEMKEEFTWTYPVGGDNVPFDGERVQYLRWNSTYSGQGQLYYELNNSALWKPISTAVPLSIPYYYWSIPDTMATGRVKMVVSDKEYVSEQFVLSKPLRLQIGFNCQDSVMVQWSNVDNAASYDIFHIENDELVRFATTSDTTMVIQKKDIFMPLFAVTPTFANGFSGFRSHSYDYNLQGVDCYLSTFIVNENESGEVELTLSLGTSHEINEIIFEKKTGAESFQGVFRQIVTIHPDHRTTYIYKDPMLHDGINTYRARIKFDNDVEIITDEYSLFVLTERSYVLYPNPVNASTDYVILHLRDFKFPESIFTLYDQRGQLVYKEILLSERSNLDLVELPEGMYIYSIYSPDGSFKGKLIIQR